MIIFEFLMEITDHVKSFVEELKAISGIDRVDVNDNGVTVAASTKEAQEKCRMLYFKFCDEDYMSRLHSEITTADTTSLLNMACTTYNKEEPNYGYKVRFNPRTVQKISR